MQVARVVRQYKPFFEGDNTVQNKEKIKQNVFKFDMYLKAKEISKKSTRSSTAVSVLFWFQKEIPSGLLAT